MKQKSFSFLLVPLMSMAATVAMAYDVEIDGIYYNLSGDEATVTYKGYDHIEHNSYSGIVIIPESFTHEGRTYHVKAIGNDAFSFCCGVTSVIIPNSVTSIGQSAFTYCTCLTSVTIPNGVTHIGSCAFRGCRVLTSINIPDNVTNIDYGTFWDCGSLTSINIPESVISIGNYAFSGTKWLSNQPDGLVYVGKVAYKYKGAMQENTAINIKDGTVSISDNAFDGCTNLTAITIPESVTNIGSNTFTGTAWYENQPDGVVYVGKYAYKYKGTMPENTTIDIKEGTKGICDYAFASCRGLKSITIPEGVTTIGNSAFQACSGLTTISIPESVTTIGADAFSNCIKLTSITIPNSVTNISNNAFYGCRGLRSVTIPGSMTSIGNNAFYLCDGLTSITIPNSVTSIGKSAFYACGLTSITIPNSVTSIGDGAFHSCFWLTSIQVESGNIVYDSRNDCNAIIETASNTLITGCKNTTIPHGVTTISERAFYQCYGLNSVTIPGSVSSIGDYAFYNCHDLTSIQVETDNTVYDSRNDCNAIIETASNTLISGCRNTIIPESVTSIGDLAFSGCSDLTSVTIPNSVTSIGVAAFSGCYGLTSVTIPNSVTSIGGYAFQHCFSLTSITIPNSVTSIGDWAFQYCSSLTSVTIGSGVTDIGKEAFYYTPWHDNQPDGLVYAGKVAYRYKGTMPENTTIDIQNGTLGIAFGAFSDCRGLTSINIPESVTSIGGSAFQGCSGLTSINIPESVTSIGGSAFQGCSGLTSINIPESVTTIGSSAFENCSGLTSIRISKNVTNIDNSTFSRCTGLTSISIPNSVMSIGQYAFSDCSGLTSISIPNGVTSIGQYAFSDCRGLTFIKIPQSVTEIGNHAFETHSSDVTLKVGMKTPINISELTFRLYGNPTLYVPKGSKAAYEALYPWSGFYNIVECNYIDVENHIIAAGNSTMMEINVNNFETNIVDFQMDLTLPEGVGIDKTGCSLSSRITDENQKLMIGKLEDGKYRLTYTSLSLTPISGNDGTLLTLKLTAEDGCVGGQATISNIRFSTSESERICMDDESFDISILYKMIYKVDDEMYQTEEFAYNTPTILADEPTKEGYTFSGWSKIPATMPNHDVEVTGSFSINSYTLTYMLDGEVYKTESVVYGTPLEKEPALTKEGYTFSGWSELPETMPADDVVITGRFYLYGDVNMDEEVDVVDVVGVARYVVAMPSANFREKLADLNFDNTVNIADAVTLVNHIAGDQNFVKAMAPSSLSYNYDQCELQLLSTGQNALSLCLNGEADFTAFQLEVDVPEAIDISAIYINGMRINDHQFLYNRVSENSYRVTALSLTNAIFKGNAGELLQFCINGQVTDDICVHDIHFVTTNGTDVTFDTLYISGQGTGVADVNMNESNDVIYDLQGRKRSMVQHGVNIVNGRKVVVK